MALTTNTFLINNDRILPTRVISIKIVQLCCLVPVELSIIINQPCEQFSSRSNLDLLLTTNLISFFDIQYETPADILDKIRSATRYLTTNYNVWSVHVQSLFILLFPSVFWVRVTNGSSSMIDVTLLFALDILPLPSILASHNINNFPSTQNFIQRGRFWEGSERSRTGLQLCRVR